MSILNVRTRRTIFIQQADKNRLRCSIVCYADTFLIFLEAPLLRKASIYTLNVAIKQAYRLFIVYILPAKQVAFITKDCHPERSEVCIIL